MATDKTLDEQVGDLFPIGGPYSDEATRAAGHAIATLVRYLNHATRTADAIPEPATVDSLIASLGAAVAGMDQLLRQTFDQLRALAARPDAYATDDDPPTAAAIMAAIHANDAREMLSDAYHQLAAAQNYTSRIGLNLPED